MHTRSDILDRIRTALTPLYGEREARSIALIAVGDLTGLSITALLTDPGARLEIEGLETVIGQLAEGVPVQYATGVAEFRGRRFAVCEGVLIPRPETEELVEWVVRAETGARKILDVGTGSGCIAVSLALELPHTELFAADISTDALSVAAENCRALGAQVTLRQADALGDLKQRFSERFDAIVSNPPYVPQSEFDTMHINVRAHEPALALFVPDDDPLRFYRAIARAGRDMLTPGGRLYFEIHTRYADEMCEMLVWEGYTDTEVRDDLFGKPRMICCRLK